MWRARALIPRIATGSLCLSLLSTQPSHAGSWHIENVTLLPRMTMFLNSAIALDKQGHPHVSYTRDGTVVHAYKDKESWITEVVDSLGGSPSVSGSEMTWVGSIPNSTIAIFDDEVHIAYLTRSENLRHAVKSQGTWVISTADTTASSYTETFSLAVDNDGNPFITYCGYPGCDDGSCSLKYAFKSSGVWQTDFIDSTMARSKGSQRSGRIPGLRSTLCMGGDSLHIVSSRRQGDVRYARKAAAWFIETITDRGGGEDVSFALDSSGSPHVAWLTENGIRYARRVHSGEWLLEDFFDSVDPSWGIISLRVDAKDTVHILYSTDDTMKYLVQNDGTWVVETVDHGTWGLVSGFRASLTLDVRGRAHVCYVGTGGPFDTEHVRILKYAFREP